MGEHSKANREGRSDGNRLHRVPILPGRLARGFARTGSASRVSSLICALLLPGALLAQGTLPATAPLTLETDFAADMVAGIGRYLDRELAASVERRQALWTPDYGSHEAYARSVAAHRERFARIIGAVEPLVPADVEADCLMQVAQCPAYTVHAVRWPVFEGVDTEGLLLEPVRPAVACIVALPDADQSPEVAAGLAEGLPPQAQFARRLAENGCRVYIPTLIDRECRWSGNPRIGMTNQPHREWIYRMSYHAGRHIIGYEVQKVLAAIDRLTSTPGAHAGRPAPLPVGVMGYGEGGLIALYAAALDARIQAVAVSGYFQSRQQVWTEPVYRNVWSLLHEFGDAEIARLIAPRCLIIEAGRGPQIDGPPALGRQKQAAPGRLTTPPIESVRAEHERARKTFEKLGVAEHLRLVEPADRESPGSAATLAALLDALGGESPWAPSGPPPHISAPRDAEQRLHRQFDQLVDHTQRLLRESHHVRKAFWAKADRTDPDKWIESCRDYRETFHTELIGASAPATLPANPRTRKILDEPAFIGYEVMLDVWPDVFAYGVLLVPRSIAPGERRPVVVCQHGLEGRPDKVVDRRIEGLYRAFGAQLADRGFVVFAPQNPYIGEDSFRVLQRKANPLKQSLFSVITRQHERILAWLGEQPFVDPQRMGFYGISYGGKTAMRVPVILPQYSLVICSADFNEYVLKVAGTDYTNGFMFVQEYEIPEFDFAHTFNYGELAGLIAPRPFMVERGHRDPVAPDEWVAFEYAKVQRLYTELGIPERTRIEYFNGGHEIHATGTFEFLHQHLNWPAP